MLLAVDVGNSHTVLAVFSRERILHSWRLCTAREATADQLAMDLGALLGHRGLPLRAINGLVIGSVVPPLDEVWRAVAQAYLDCRVITVGPNTTAGLVLDVDRPQDLGADRIADAVAAWRLHGAPLVVVDLGTATKVEAVGAGGRYLGGAIAPGVGVSSEALFGRAALLHRISLQVPSRALGRDTASQMQSGIAFGFAGQVDGLVERVREEMGGAERVVATGGWASVVVGLSRTVTVVDPWLTVQGLRLIYESAVGTA